MKYVIRVAPILVALALFVSFLVIQQTGSVTAQGAVSATLDQDFVSNVSTATNAVVITVVDAAEDGNINAPDVTLDTQISIKNVDTGDVINLVLNETGDSTDIFTGTFNVVVATTSPTGQIIAAESAKIEVSYTTDAGATIVALSSSGNLSVEVDATGPPITNSSPIDGTASNVATQLLQAEVTDAKAGVGADKAAVESGVTINVDGANFVPVATDLGGGLWRVSVAVTLSAGNHTWSVTANDTLNNPTTSDSDPDTGGNQPFALEIDQTAPDFVGSTAGDQIRSRTGDVADSSADPTVVDAAADDRKFIRLGFNDKIDSASVEAADFRVLLDGVEQAIDSVESHEDIPKNVFVKLVNELPSDATPVVKIVGEIKDDAGNVKATGEFTVDDGIAPLVSVSVTGTGASRPVSNKDHLVRVSVDEDSTNPTISVGLTVTKVGTTTQLTTVKAASTFTTISDKRVWEWKVSFNEASTADMGMYNVFVTISDGAQSGTKGDATDPSDDDAILFEVDTQVAAPAFLPDTETDNANAFVTMDFANEGLEYGSTGTAFIKVGDTGFDPTTIVDDYDEHDTVSIVSATVDGNSVTPASNDSIKWVIAPQNLSLGEHTVIVTVQDLTGNVETFTHTFEVKARAPITVSLSPGWNLISLPGQPSNTAIDAVMANTPDAESVVTFDPTRPGGFLVAVRGADGNFTGTLKTMDGAHGYWVLTSSFTPIEVDVPPLAVGAGALPPTLAIAKGWNLVPVLDVAGTKVAGDAIDADKYFASATGVTAVYFFDTVLGQWTFIDISASGGGPGREVLIGRAYWAFSTEAGSLVPVP